MASTRSTGAEKAKQENPQTSERQQRKARTKVDPNESKRDKFVRLATARTENALKTIGHLGNLSTSAYEWTPEDVSKIVGSLRNAVEALDASFAKNDKSRESFSL